MTPAANSNSKHHDLKSAYPLRQKNTRLPVVKLPVNYQQLTGKVALTILLVIVELCVKLAEV